MTEKTEEQIKVSNQGKSGFDVFGNPVDTSASNVSGSLGEAEDKLRFTRTSEKEDKAVDVLSDPLETETVEEIQARKTKAAQGQIDALNRTYQDKLAEQTKVNVGQERRTSSVNTLTGLAGSSEAGVQAKKTEDIGNKQLDAIRNEQAVVISGILSDISNSAIQEARQQTLDARQSAEDVLAMRVKRQSDVVDKLSILSQGGATLDGLKSTMSPEDYNYIVKNAGGEEMMKGYLALNRPVESIIDKRVENGKYIIAYQNPITGETRIETTDLGIPNGYSKTIDAGDRILAIPDNWGGDPADLITINKGLTPAQAQPKTTSGGKTIVDENGNVVEEVSDLTKGILENIASLKDLTPSGREEVIAEIYRSGRGGELSNKMDEYAVNKADSVLPAIDLALEQLKETSTGFVGAGVVKIPGTDAFRLQSTLDTIFANIAFGELTAMRSSSPTGGALGQVSERELALLGSVQASLKFGIGDELMKGNLEKVQKVFEGIKERASKTQDLSSMVQQAGYDYEAMKADGLSDEEIKQAIQ